MFINRIASRKRIKKFLKILAAEEILSFLLRKAEELKDPAILKMSFPFVKSEVELFRIMKLLNKSIPYTYKNALPFIKLGEKSEDELVAILRLVNYEKSYVKKIIPLLKFDEKTDKKIINLLSKVNYRLAFSEEAIKFLSINGILNVLSTNQKESYFKNLKKHALRQIDFNKRSQKKLISILKTTLYDKYYCRLILPLLSRYEVLNLLKENNYEEWALKRYLPYLKR